MMTMRFSLPTTFTGVVFSWVCTGGLAAATLQLDVHSGGQPPYAPGDSVVVVLSMSDLGMDEAAGFQTFLTFDPSELTFVSGSYTAEPFGLPILSVIEADGNEIDLAAGIDSLSGQTPTSEDSVLAMLFFEAQQNICLPAVSFRANTPPTQLTDDSGEPIGPLTLNNLMATNDCNDNNIEDSCDIASGMSDDTNNNSIPDECEAMPIVLDIANPGVDDPDTTGETVSRCLHIVLLDCVNGDQLTLDQDVTFTDGTATNVDIDVECEDWTEVCVKDQRHTQWASSPLADDGSSCFNDQSLSLASGDTDNDSDVDINDVTLFIAQFGGAEPGAMCPPALDGDGEPVNRGADFDGDGNVGAEDYSLLSENWLTETFCECPVMAMGGRPNVAGFETAAPVSRFPAEIAAAADLNRDNVIDHRDVAIFERINQLPDALSDAIRRSRQRGR